MSDDGKKEDTPVEEVVKHPEEVKPVEETPPPIDKPENNDSDLKGLVDGLAERVSGLESLVQSVVSDGGQDETPGGKTPWTHRRFF